MVAFSKLLQKPDLSVDQVIAEIKRSWACHGENFKVDGGIEYIPLTQKEKEFNDKLRINRK
jgi:hypothetical protein